MKFEAILFDLDGTLLDTLDDLTDAVNYALRQEGFPCRGRDEVRMFVGNGISRLLSLSVPAGTEESRTARALACFRTYYAGHAALKTHPYPGIPELLQTLTAQGMKIAVVSNKFDAAVKALSRQYFPCIPEELCIGEAMPMRRKKPAPDSLFDALALLGVPKENAVYVGDSEVDIETAKNAQIPCISCTWGFRGEAALLKAGAEIIISSPAELPAALDVLAKEI